MNDRRLSSIWLIGAAIPAGLFFMPSPGTDPQIKSSSGPILTIDGHRFRDLDRNGRLAAYEDWRLPAERRTSDLIGRMTLAEKAGTMVQMSLPGIGTGGSPRGYDLTRIGALVRQQGITRFVTPLALPPRQFAEQTNAVQAIGEASRLGIPITISTGPNKPSAAAPARFSASDTPASILAAVRGGRVLEGRIDDAIRPIITAKFATGLFENPYVEGNVAEKAGCSPDCRL
ncbi:hypothetical protein [Sphingomonas sp. M1A8_2b]